MEGSAGSSLMLDMTKKSALDFSEILNPSDCCMGYLAKGMDVRLKIPSACTVHLREFMLTVTLCLTTCDDPIPKVWILLNTGAQDNIINTTFAKSHGFLLDKL